MIRSGSPTPLGATVEGDGTNFAVFSSVATRVELCLFDEAGNQTAIHLLPDCTEGVWHGFLPNCKHGQRYGFRVHGLYEPVSGARCNPAKLLIDPYARALDGDFVWHNAVFDSEFGDDKRALQMNTEDSAPHVPKSVVYGQALSTLPRGSRVTWSDTIFYEINVRGYTMLHPAVAGIDRGKFNGLRNKDVLSYIRSLGITSVELMPLQAFIDEHHLVEKNLRNFWGYNPIGYFAPAMRYANVDGIAEFRDMVRAIHDAGLEVILDVVYNHTGEGDQSGPTISFRGLDNIAYYRTPTNDPGSYVNDTGCGNTLNVGHARVRNMIVDSLRYWHNDMGVDGFRFDLAPVLGRHEDGFRQDHPLLLEITSNADLQHAKLIAEPWDVGPDGYQLGNFPPQWSEWNDRFRDSIRRFWRGDHGVCGEFAKRLSGSADIFDHSDRSPVSSVNFVASHDGYTLADTVSYEHRHNLANGENNRDGHRHNFSKNYGVEGDTDDESILAMRSRQRLNLLATLLLSQGTPLILGGDEFGNSQHGNNNAYAQDNVTGWLNWADMDADPQFTDQVRELIWLRREIPLVHLPYFLHGSLSLDQSTLNIDWFGPDGKTMQSQDWASAQVFGVTIYERKESASTTAVATLFNRTADRVTFRLPSIDAAGSWRIAFSTDDLNELNDRSVMLPASSVALLLAN